MWGVLCLSLHVLSVFFFFFFCVVKIFKTKYNYNEDPLGML